MLTRYHVCTGHKAALYALAPGRQAGYFLTAGGDGWITEWDIREPETGRLVANIDNRVFALAVSPADWPAEMILAGNMLGGLHWINRAQPDEGRNVLQHSKGIFDVLWLEDQVFTAGGDGVLTRWDATRQRATESIQLSNRSLRSIAWNAVERIFALGASDGKIYYVDHQLALLGQVSAHQFSVFSTLWSADGQTLITGGRDALLKSWVNQNTNTASIPAHHYTINHIVPSPDGQLLATASRDKTIKIWKSSDLSLLKVLETIRDNGHLNSVNRLLWTPEGLLSCSDDRTVIIWKDLRV